MEDYSLIGNVHTYRRTVSIYFNKWIEMPCKT